LLEILRKTIICAFVPEKNGGKPIYPPMENPSKQKSGKS
jgi:hypothetical protein